MLGHLIGRFMCRMYSRSFGAVIDSTRYSFFGDFQVTFLQVKAILPGM